MKDFGVSCVVKTQNQEGLNRKNRSPLQLTEVVKEFWKRGYSGVFIIMLAHIPLSEAADFWWMTLSCNLMMDWWNSFYVIFYPNSHQRDTTDCYISKSPLPQQEKLIRDIHNGRADELRCALSIQFARWKNNGRARAWSLKRIVYRLIACQANNHRAKEIIARHFISPNVRIFEFLHFCIPKWCTDARGGWFKKSIHLGFLITLTLIRKYCLVNKSQINAHLLLFLASHR